MLENKVVLVTGANRGIGKEIVETFLNNGAVVVANDIETDNLNLLKEKFNDKIIIIEGDISKIDDVKNIFFKIKEKFSKLDVLVNNAGILKDNFIIMTKEEDWDKIMDVNLKGSFLCLQHAAKMMMRQQKGSIINISSIVGIRGNQGQCAYSSSKAAIIGLTKSSSKELGQFNIRVNAIAPGVIKTKLIEHLSPEIIENFIKNTSLKRIGNPSDIAKTALFLASDLSDFITGEIISVDGGLII